MARISRKTAKIFGLNAGVNQIGEFGSFAAGTPTTTTDLDVIQSGAFSKWLEGWFTAIVGANSPAIEDMNAFCYVMGYQIAYLMQQGVPEWNSTTVYYNGSIVSNSGVPPAGITTGRQLYICIATSSTNNALTDGNYWFPLNSGALNPQANTPLGARAVGTWTAKASGDTSFWRGICWSDVVNKFVAVATATSGADQVMTSTDGTTWTGQVSASTLAWSSVDYSPELGLFVAVAITGGGGTVQSMFSADGTTWSTAGVTTVSGSWTSVKWIPELGIFVAVGDSSGTNPVMTSSDGKIWAARSVPTAGVDWSGLSWSAELGLMVSFGNSPPSNSYSMHSADGITWVVTSVSVNVFTSCTWAKEIRLFVAVGDSSFGDPGVLVSRDGVTWQNQTASDTSAWSAVTWSSELGLFIAVAATTAGTSQVMTSPNGITWTSRVASSVKSWKGIAWSPKLGIAASVAFNGGATAGMVMISKFVKKFIAP